MEQTRAFAASIMVFKEREKSLLLQLEGGHGNHKETWERI
jgi:hypothetical protein